MADIFVKNKTTGQTQRVNSGDLGFYESRGWEQTQAPGKAYQYQGYDVYKMGNNATVDVGGVGYTLDPSLLSGVSVADLREYTGSTTSGKAGAQAVADALKNKQYEADRLANEQAVAKSNAVAEQLRPLLESKLGRGVRQEDLNAILGGQDINTYVNSLSPDVQTDYMKAFDAGKAQGLTPDQISQNYASEQQKLNPQNYPTPQTPTPQTSGGTDEVISVKNKNGETINVYKSSIPQLIKEGVLPEGTTGGTTGTTETGGMTGTAGGGTPLTGYTPLKPADLLPGTTLKESDLARTNGVNIYKRDLGAEQAKIDEFIQATGKMPSSKQDWLDFHDYVYEGKMPDGEGESDATGQTGGKNGMSDGQAEIDAQAKAEAQAKAQATLDQYNVQVDESKSMYANVKDTISKVYNDLGVSDIQANIKVIGKEIEDLKGKMAEEISVVSENPWLSEALRSRKITNIQNKYDSKMTALNSRLQLEQSLYGDAQEEARFVAGQVFNLQADQQDFDQQLVLKAMESAEKEKEAQRDLSMEGFQYISDPKQLAGLSESEIYRDPATGRIYKRPVKAVKSSGGGGVISKTNNNSSPKNNIQDVKINKASEDFSPDIIALAKAYNRGETLGSIGATTKAQVLRAAEQLKLEQASTERPQSAEAMQNLLAQMFEEGYSDVDIINGLVEDFGYQRDVATRLVNINKPS